MKHIIAVLAFLLPSAAMAQPSVAPGGSTTLTTATGSTTPRTLAARAADQLNILDYGADSTGSAASDAAFSAVIAQALTLGVPVNLYLPCGTYKITAAISITTSASQGVLIGGQGAACVTINQTADADALDVSLTNYGGLYATGAVRVSGIKFILSIASTTRKAVSISSTAASGALGVPVVLHDLTFVSASSTSYWADSIYLSQIPNATYIDTINYEAPYGYGDGISVNGTSSGYTSGVFIRDTFMVGGARSLEMGNYVQGVTVSNMNVVNGQYAIYWVPTAGTNSNLTVANSYLDGQVSLSGASATLNTIWIYGSQLDSLATTTTGWTNLAINTAGAVLLENNIFRGSSASTNQIGLSISGLLYGVTVNNNRFAAFSGTGGVALSATNTTYNINFSGNSFAYNNTPAIIDATAVGNVYINTIIDNFHHLTGNGLTQNGISLSSGLSGTSLANVNLQGPDTNVGAVLSAQGLPEVDWYFRDGHAHSILRLRDSGDATVDAGLDILGAAAGISPSILPVTTTNNFYLGCANAYATNAAGCFPQIPTMAGMPTGTPATTGGASIVYDTTHGELWAYSPTTSAWVPGAATGCAPGICGTGADGTTTSVGCGAISSGTVTLARDAHCSSLTLSGSGKIFTAGYKIFSTGVCDLSAAGAQAIYNNGTAGNNAAGATGGASVAAANNPNQATLWAMIASGKGGDGTTTTGGNGVIGSGIRTSFGGGAPAGASGGASTSAGGTGAGVATQVVGSNAGALFPVIAGNQLSSGGTVMFPGLSASGSGAGGGDAVNAGGGGGSGGLGGGHIYIACGTIARGTNSTASIIQSIGGKGGNGANGVGGTAGGGGGAPGGGGGMVQVVAGILTGSAITNAVDVSGGTSGNGGNGLSTGLGGLIAPGANGGGYALIVLNPASVTSVIAGNSVSGSAGTGPSGATGGTGGVGAVSRGNL